MPQQLIDLSPDMVDMDPMGVEIEGVNGPNDTPPTVYTGGGGFRAQNPSVKPIVQNGRGGGAYTGPQLPPHPSAIPEPPMGFKQALIEELPYTAAAAASMGAGYLMRGIPVVNQVIQAASKAAPIRTALGQLAVRAGAAGVGAGGTQMAQNVSQGKPMSENVTNKALTAGVGPEVVGSGVGAAAGYAAKKFGNLRARWNADFKNDQYLAETTNPKKLPVGQAGSRVGKEVQAPLWAQEKAMREGLESGYDDLMGGQFGQARKMKYSEGEPSEFMMDDAGNMTAIPDAPPQDFTVTETGPSISKLHSRNAALGAQARRPVNGMPNTAPARQAANYKQMSEIAEQNGFTMDEYNNLGNAWREMVQTYHNPQMKKIMESQGTDVIEILANPSKWKAFGIKRPGGARTTTDAPDLLNMMRDTIGPEAWPKVQAAVGRRMVFNARTNGVLDPDKLGSAVDQLVKYRVDKELVNNAQELADIAKVIREGTKDPKLPYVTHGNLDLTNLTALTNFAMQKGGMQSPDARRMVAQLRGHKGIVEKLMRVLGKLSVYGAGAYSDLETKRQEREMGLEVEIPNPPARAQGAFNGSK